MTLPQSIGFFSEGATIVATNYGFSHFSLVEQGSANEESK